jgi:hypothetical protein
VAINYNTIWGISARLNVFHKISPIERGKEEKEGREGISVLNFLFRLKK